MIENFSPFIPHLRFTDEPHCTRTPLLRPTTAETLGTPQTMSHSASSPGESPLPTLPQTPPGKEIPFPESQFTPDAHYRLSTLKRKASEASLSAPPRAGGGYVKWRLLVVRAQLDVVKCTRESLREAFRGGKLSQEEFERYRAETFDEQDELEDEEKQLLEQGKFIEEDLNDSIAEAEGAYIHELYMTWRRASSEGQKDPKKERRLAPNKFNNAVAQYLGAEEVTGTDTKRFCSILGIWITKAYTKCAHIVPKSFETKNLAYIFGANDAALASVRNGIIMNSKFEEAFDNGWVTIVPDGSVEATPTQWKVVLLNDRVKRDTVFTEDSGKLWRFEVMYLQDAQWLISRTYKHQQELHGRKLTFQNDNRPARRYLYFRYVMALMHAEYEKWEGYRDKVPPGRIWASPSKPEGYLRKSVLRGLARKVHDEDILPEELVEAGGFEDTDPPTGTEAADQMAGLELGIEMRRECKKKTMKVEEEDEDDMDDMEE